jgi:hypothetical protein
MHGIENSTPNSKVFVRRSITYIEYVLSTEQYIILRTLTNRKLLQPCKILQSVGRLVIAGRPVADRQNQGRCWLASLIPLHEWLMQVDVLGRPANAKSS